MIWQYPLPLPHHETMAADDLMVTASNREAAAWINQWPNWPTHCLVIYGPSGSGKTHLAQVWQEHSKAKNLKPADLTMQGIESAGNIMLIDNADTITGIPEHEEALFHLYNRLKETKGFLLLTGKKAPASWNEGQGISLADLRSRLLSVPAIGIAAPDDEFLSALLIKQFRDRQIDLGADVVDYLLPRVERTPAAIRAIVAALDRASLSEGRRITVALARKLLEDEGFLI